MIITNRWKRSSTNGNERFNVHAVRYSSTSTFFAEINYNNYILMFLENKIANLATITIIPPCYHNNNKIKLSI